MRALQHLQRRPCPAGFHIPRARKIIVIAVKQNWPASLRNPVPSRRNAAVNSVSLTANGYAEASHNGTNHLASVSPLPPVPTSSKIFELLPYIFKLALSEKQLAVRVALALGCTFLSKGAGLACPLILRGCANSLTTGLIDAALMSLIFYGACNIVQNLAKEIQQPTFAPVYQAVARRVAYNTFQHILDLDVRFHLERKTGRLARILERGTRSVQMLFRALLFTFLPTLIELVIVCAVLAHTISPWTAGVVGCTFVVYVAWTLSLTERAAEQRKEVNQLENLVSSKAVDALLNFETVALFNNQKIEVHQYDRHLRDYQAATVSTEVLQATLNAGQAVILACGLTSVMASAIISSPTTSITAGDIIMLQGLLLQLWAPLQFLGWFYREVRQSLVDMEEFFGILQTRSSLIDGAKQLPHTPVSTTAAMAGDHLTGNGADSNGHHHLQQLNGAQQPANPTSNESTRGLEVDLRDVKFWYHPDREVLRGVNLHVAPGESVAVVGASGSGKSTILRLVMRLYDVRGGCMAVNGVDVRELKLDSLRNAIGVVPQDTVLFNDTIMQNIRYGRPDAGDEEVMEAARLAKLHDAVQSMPERYDTMVGERGLKLSGGEKQRVAIARAFLRAPRLLICDEATSALDSATEAAIMTSLSELAKGRSSIFVAHRLSTIRNCDRIVVMSEGRVVEEGPHDALMAVPGGVYASMWQAQAAQQKLAELRQGEEGEEEESRVEEPEAELAMV